jgi:leader peptidase (prepilin peptidase) / N-methyltransferase
MFSVFQTHPVIFLVSMTLLGLIVGSFLNVVIHRLPIMMQRGWEAECRAFFGETDGRQHSIEARPEAAFNLIVPRSQCPHCGHDIRAVENIPVISYLALRGRCSQCHAPISAQYPAVEALTAALSLLAAWRYGYGWETLAALALTWALIALAGIDLKTKLLPDAITLPVLWLGLLANMAGLFTDLQSAVLGAVFGYLSLWGVYQLFKLLTGKEGMGYGDFKLLAMLGAWTGWQALPLIILLSSLVGAIVGVGLIAFKGRDRNIPIPFGPYLAAAGWIAFMWGPQITEWYLRQML